MIIFSASLLLIEIAESEDHNVYQVQKKLKELGYDPGSADGIWGKKTTSAIKHFQRDNGLPVTGHLDEKTRAKLFIKKLPSIIFVILIALTAVWLFGFYGFLEIGTITTINNLILLWAIGFITMGFGAIGRTSFMYRSGFEPNNVVELITTINVSPVRPRPSIIEGKIIGKGIAGYWLSEDLYFKDNTGLMYIDYRFGLRLMDFWWALRRADQLVGQNVRIQGWYRRGPAPYFQVDTIWTQEGKRFRNYSKHMTYILAGLFFIIGAFLFYLWFTVI